MPTALAFPDPGSTVYLRGGTYALDGNVNVALAGTAADPIIVQPYPGESAAVDLAQFDLIFSGDVQNIHFRNLEFFSSDGGRVSEEAGSDPSDITLGTVVISAPYVNFYNCYFHDLREVEWWSPAVGGRFDSCQMINIGWSAPDRGHGHGLYTQNGGDELKVIHNCIIGPCYGLAVQNSGTSLATLAGYRYTNCIFLDRVLCGGFSPFSDLIIDGCSYWGCASELGYSDNDDNIDFVFANNYVGNGDRALQVHKWQQMTVTGNVFHSLARQANWAVESDNPVSRNWDNNVYHGANQFDDPNFNAETFVNWQLHTGFDATSTYDANTPSTNVVKVYACDTAPRVAHIAIYNWEQTSTVDVDVSRFGLLAGVQYRLRSVYNPTVDTSEFEYDGRGIVTCSFDNRTVAIPTGAADALTTIDPRFGAWILEEL